MAKSTMTAWALEDSELAHTFKLQQIDNRESEGEQELSKNECEIRTPFFPLRLPPGLSARARDVGPYIVVDGFQEGAWAGAT